MTTGFHQKPNLYVSHVQLKVANLQNSIEFYTTIMGFKVLEQTADTVYLTFDGKTTLLSLVEVPNAISHQGFTGLYHFALLLPTRTDLGNVIQHFIKHNVRIGAGDHHVSEALYLNDPDGNGIEIYIDRPTDHWKWNAEGQVYMTTEQVNIPSVLAEADGTWNGLPEGTVMGHIHLSVSDLTKTEAFYTNILEYEVVSRYGDQALFISTGKYHHHIGLNTWHSQGQPALPANATGLASYTVVLKDEQYAAQVKSTLQAAGAVIEEVAPTPFDQQVQFAAIDPSGIKIIFSVQE